MIGALIMVHGDDSGLVLPPKIAPKQVSIIGIGTDNEEVKNSIDKNYEALKNAGISVYVDDTDRSPGFKFAESEVNGIPVRIEIGKKDLEQGKITICRRDTKEKFLVDKDVDIVSYVKDLFDKIQTNLFETAKKRMEEKTFEAHSLEDIEKIMSSTPGFVKADWCGNQECELKLKEIRGTKSRCILENEKLLDGKCVVCGKEAKHLVAWGIQY